VTRLLIVEDDASLSLGLADAFGLDGMEVAVAREARRAEELLFSRHFDLVILDLMLPDKSGLELLQEMRRQGLETPVLVLTAKVEEDDRVLGLELGADDYVTKPFSLRELGARVRALLRRTGGKARRQGPPMVPFLLGKTLVDPGAYEIRRKGKKIPLSNTESRMLALLFSERDRVVTRNRFLLEIWGEDPPVGDRTVDTHVLNLRKKIEPRPGRPRYLLTVRGAGYKLTGARLPRPGPDSS